MHSKMTKARIKAIINQPFFGYFLMKMNPQEKDDTFFQQLGFPPTMATDGNNLYYSKEFLDSLTDNDLYFVLIHEVSHVAFQSTLRRQHRDRILWNIASDYAINYHIMEIVKEIPHGA